MNVSIIGGAGFIGSNLAEHFIKAGDRVTVLDNLSRPGGGAARNIGQLLSRFGDQFVFLKGDVRDMGQVFKAVRKSDVVLNLAAQTAMTWSLDDPFEDFETNALGMLNVLEAARVVGKDPLIIYTSTNKVYGDLTRQKVELVETPTRWDFKDLPDGIDESYPLDYEGPYGCSKGCGDAYCLDYARSFSLRTVVFRMSGIYGVSQYPTEDQGWVAWIVRQALLSRPVTIFGDGKQVRDVLYITDLVSAFEKAIDYEGVVAGRVYNIGGGRSNSVSVLELLTLLQEKLHISPSHVEYADWRRADQKVYISNTAKATRDFDWEPTIDVTTGVLKLLDWLGGSGA